MGAASARACVCSRFEKGEMKSKPPKDYHQDIEKSFAA